jgi:hypothetical protein
MYEPYKPYRDLFKNMKENTYTVTDSDGKTYFPFPPLEKNATVNSPIHYTWHPCGLEARDVAQEFTYNIGTAIAYLWRHEYKNGIEDLEKAIKHIEFEIDRLSKKG